jgi:hypothetical protein
MLQFVTLSSLLACSTAFVAAPLPGNIPIAMHKLVVVGAAGDSVIRLKSFDENSFDVRETTLYMLELCLIIKIFMRSLGYLYPGVSANYWDVVSVVASL